MDERLVPKRRRSDEGVTMPPPSQSWDAEADALENAGERREREMRDLAADARLAYEDSLTGLPNRRAFHQKAMDVFTALRNKTPINDIPVNSAAMIAFDIDNFKNVNDEYGHEAGDEVLRKWGELLAHSFRADDVLGRVGERAQMGGVARTGGEEFFAFMVGASTATAVNKANAVRDAFKKITFELRNKSGALESRSFTVSIGVAGTDTVPDSGGDVQSYIDTVMRKADKALYAAKGGGRDRVIPFTPELDEAVAK